MIIAGLSENEQNAVIEVFRRHAEIERVTLFGSRAKGTARSNSDLDLAVYGVTDDLKIEGLAIELEELPMPYKFDIKAFENIRHIPLREHIQRVGIVIYSKSSRP